MQEAPRTNPFFDRLTWIDGSVAPSLIPSAPGLYILRLDLPETSEITVGRLGTFVFPTGCYFYTGSALGGLRGRLGWHLRADKSPRWHIDYLRARATIHSIGIVRTTERGECTLHQEAIARWNGRIIAPRFGASDCRCVSHLGWESDAVPMPAPTSDSAPL